MRVTLRHDNNTPDGRLESKMNTVGKTGARLGASDIEELTRKPGKIFVR